MFFAFLFLSEDFSRDMAVRVILREDGLWWGVAARKSVKTHQTSLLMMVLTTIFAIASSYATCISVIFWWASFMLPCLCVVHSLKINGGSNSLRNPSHSLQASHAVAIVIDIAAEIGSLNKFTIFIPNKILCIYLSTYPQNLTLLGSTCQGCFIDLSRCNNWCLFIIYAIRWVHSTQENIRVWVNSYQFIRLIRRPLVVALNHSNYHFWTFM